MADGLAPRLLRDQAEKVGVRDCVRELGSPWMKRQIPYLLGIHRGKGGVGPGIQKQPGSAELFFWAVYLNWELSDVTGNQGRRL